MADISRHFRQRRLAGGAGVERAHPYDIYRMTRTGEAEQFRAIAGMGRGVQKVSEDKAKVARYRKAIQDDTTLDDAIMALKDYDFKSFVELEQLPFQEFQDNDQFRKLEADSLKKRKAFAKGLLKGKNQEVTGALTDHINASRNPFRMTTHQAVFNQQQEFNREGYFNKKAKMLSQGTTTEELTGLIDRHRGWFTPTEMRREKATVDKLVADSQYAIFKENVWQAVNEMPYEEAVSLTNDIEGLEREDRNDIIRRLERKQDMFDAGMKREEQEYFDQTNEEFWQLLRDNNLVEAQKQVDESNLPVKGDGGKNWWTNLIKKAADALAKGEPNPIEQSDPEIELKISKMINLEPEKVTKQMIYGYVGKGKKGGLSLTSAEKYIKLWEDKQTDPDNVLNRPVVKRGFTFLEELKDMEISLTKAARKEEKELYTLEEARADLIKWVGIKNDFEQWITKNPDATDKEVEDKLGSLTEDMKTKVAEGILSRIWMYLKESPFPSSWLYRKIISEEEEPEFNVRTKLYPAGMIEQGNIDLANQFVRRNKDGSVSTLRSKSFNFNGQEVLLDMVDQTGKLLTDKEAKEQYKKTGKHLGKFSSVEATDKYAQALSKQQAKQNNIELTSAPTIEFDDVWDSLDDEQKKQVWSAFRNGWSADEIKNVLEIE